jgi:transcriptional regulator GlxA family with amidase domain
MDAGFSDCAHFSRHFKATHGFAPSEQRGNTRRDAPDLAGLRVFG